MLDDRLEQRRHVAAAVTRVERGKTLDRGGVDDRKVELRLGGAQAVEQVERLVEHPVRARFVTVDLVDHDDRTQTVREGLLRDEPRLRHRAVDRVHEQQHRIDHRQHALDFAAEIGVPGRIDDVDAVAVPLDGRVLGQDGDAAFLFERVRVHDALWNDRAGVKRAGLLQELVDQRGLAMVDMRDDRDVAEVLRWVRGHVLRQGLLKARKKGAKYSGLSPLPLHCKKWRPHPRCARPLPRSGRGESALQWESESHR